MVKRIAMLITGALLVGTDARAQTAGAALREVLFEPLQGTGALSANASEALYLLLLGETTTFPIGSSAGGFTWTFDSVLNAPIRRSKSFGPMFAERPFTTGLRRLNVGLSFQHTKFASVGGQPLTDLTESVSYSFGESVYSRSSSLAVTIDRTIVSATYGLHDRIDVGLIVPVGRPSVSGSSSFYYKDFTGVSTLLKNHRGSSFGVGDAVIRAKTAVIAARRFDGAVGLDVRLPTGDADKLLGTGHTQAKLMFIGASTVAAVTPHVNIGYTFGGSGLAFGPDNRWAGSFGDPELIRREPSEEFNYTVGVDVAANSAITIAADLIGRAVKNSAALSVFDSGSSYPDRVTFFQITPGTVNLLLGAVGAKVSVGGSWLATGTILFPLNDRGLKPAVTPVIGFERAF